MHCSKTKPSFDFRMVESRVGHAAQGDICSDKDVIAFVALLNYNLLRGSTVSP
jgi:hypothetical protein